MRDPASGRNILILEQSYRADPVSMEILLAQNEGKIIDFLIRNGDRVETIPGKIVRAGVMPRPGLQFQPQRTTMFPSIIEVGGKLRFELPGTPLFPGLGEGTQLKPSLNWLLQSDNSSTGFNWSADCNVVQNAGNTLDISAYVTVDNQSGKTFQNAALKLMAGDVQKLQPQAGMASGVVGGIAGGVPVGIPGARQITEKTFDEYHLYTLSRPVTLRDKESKQVEFVRASNIASEILYVYDGAKIDSMRIRMSHPDMLRQDTSLGSESQPKSG